MKENNLSKNTLLLAIGTFINKGLLFIMIPLFSSWLSNEDYGKFDVFCTYVALMIPIVTLACNEAVFRFGIEKETDSEKGIYITNGLFIVGVNSIIMGLALLFVFWATGWRYAFPFFLMSLAEIVNTYLQGYMRAIRKLNIYSFCSAFSTLCIAFCVTILLLVFDLGLMGIIYGYAFGYIMGDLAIIFVTRFFKYIDFSKVQVCKIKEMVSYSSSLIPNNISWWIISVSDRTIINIVLGDAINGIYAIASKIPNFCTAIFGVFGISWQETATDMVSSEKRNEYYNRVLNQMVKVLISLCGVIVCFNFVFFEVVFESRYGSGRLYTPILVTSAVFSSLSQYFGGIQISLKRPKANGFSTVIGAIVNLVVHLSLISFIDLYAAAISTLISNVVIMIVRAKLISDEIKFTLEKNLIFYGAIYFYFVVGAYLRFGYVWHSINLIISLFVFCYVNKNMINRFIKKIIKY